MARPRVPVQRPLHLAWLITGPLVVVAALFTLPMAVNHARFGSPQPLLGLAFFGLFVLADATLLRFEIRRHGFSLSLAEIPLLLALFYLPPLTVLTVRVLSTATIQLKMRAGPVRSCFNVASMAAGTAAANLIVYLYLPGLHVTGLTRPEVGPRTWIVLAAAVFANTLATLLAVGGVITVVQGWASSRPIVRSAGSVLIVGLVNVTVSLIMLLALQESRWAILLLAGLAVVVGVVYRAYAQFLRQHKSLSELYELTREVAEAGADLPDVLLDRVRALLQAESATLWLPPHARHTEMLLSAKVDYSGLLDTAVTPDSLRRKVVDAGHTVAIGPRLGDSDLRAQLREQGVKDVIVVPLRSGNAVIGTLEVAGRLGDTAHFSRDDVRLLETLAAHVGVAVENSRLVDRLRFDAYHDGLTQLPNRRRMLAALDEAVKVRAPGEVVAILVFDVAGLRDVNDSLGHNAGDRVLVEVATRLRDLAPPGALVSRIGGDEFALSVRTANADTAVELAGRVRAALRDRMVLGSLTIHVDAAVGVAVHPDHGADAATLLQRADVATYAAKAVPSAIQVFNPGLESRSVRRLGLAADLRRVLERAELDVYFQPKVGLRDRRLVGVECLARWEHPVHGSVAPEDFVAVAEHTGQVGRLTEVVLRAGLRRAREWAERGRPLSIAVNLSSRCLVDPGFPDTVAELLEEYGVPPERLTLELTEADVVGDPDRPLPILYRLRDLGVRLSVDDFGAGNSSLAYLRRLPVQEVKVDRAFVQDMATDPGDLAIVRAIVDLARHFGLSVVAEGVESELTLGLLEDMGCDVGQGFLFSRPLPHERLDAWFSAQTDTEPSPAGEVRWLRAVT